MKKEETEQEDIYNTGRFSIKRIFVVSGILVFLGFFFNFPITQIIKKNVAKTLTTLRNCPISYSKIDVEYLFFPKVILRNPSISGYCFGNSKEKLDFKELIVSLYIPGFLPPGIRFNIPIIKDKTKIDAYITLGLGKFHINIKNSVINGKFLSKFSSFVKNINGDVNVNILTTIEGKKPQDGNFLIDSKNLTIGAQNIMGIQLPSLNIGDLQLKAQFNKPDFKIINLLIGNKNSPIKAKLTGSINYNTKYPKKSILDLKGSIFFSQKFISDFPILNLLLAGKKANSEGGYNIELKGTLTQPLHQFK
jgi:type II secretion system protein N